MKLYHGTSEAAVAKILEKGLCPRKNRSGNWDMKSNPSAVYLTSVYAPYFAINTNKKNLAILEIDTNKIPQELLLPDEDALEQINRGRDSLSVGISTIEQRTAWYRKNLRKYNSNGQWLASLQTMGTCSYWGSIPKEAITRIVFFSSDNNKPWVYACLDASITITNYKIMGEKYKVLNSVLFDDRIEDEPDHEKYFKKAMSNYCNVWDIAKEFDRSKVRKISF